MSEFDPIGGVSLEAYAKLCGLMSKTQPEETDKHAQIAADNGVSNADWEVAKSGWTEAMVDPTKAMAIQQVFMPIYQNTLAEMSGGEEPCTLEKYAEIKSAMIHEKDESGEKIAAEIILDRYGYKITEWGTIETYWVSRVSKDEHGRVIDNYNEADGSKFRELIQMYADKYAASQN